MLFRNDFAEKMPSHLGFLKFCAVQLHGNKHKESLFVNSEEIIWTRPFKI